jgi:hypothetical protein
MALVDIGHIRYPYTPRGLYDLNTDTLSNSHMNDATDNIAWVIQITKAGTLEQIHCRTATVGGDQTLRVSFQELDANGKPDGTDVEWRDVAVLAAEDKTIIQSGIITDDGTDTGVKRVVAVGDRFAVVFAMPAWTTSTLQLGYMIRDSDEYGECYPLFANSPPTFTHLFGDIVGAVEYDDATFGYIPNMMIFSSTTSVTIDDADTPDEYALKIQVPFSCRVSGVWMKGGSGSVNSSFITLYSAGGSTLKGPITASDKTFGSNAHTKIYNYNFDTPLELTANTVYRISWKPPASPAAKIFWYYSFPDAAMRETMSNGLNMEMSSRVDSGAWTDSDTDMPVGGFIIDQVDDGAGGGGGSCALTNGTAVIPATCPV